MQRRAVVVATGGLSIPKIGATDFGYRIARQFGLRVVEPRPALVPLTFDGAAWEPFAPLAGISLPVDIETGAKKARMPSSAKTCCSPTAACAARRCCRSPATGSPGTPIAIDLLPEIDVARSAGCAPRRRSRKRLGNELAALAAARGWPTPGWRRTALSRRPAGRHAATSSCAALAERSTAGRIAPTGTEGYRKAEVTRRRRRHPRPVAQTMDSRSMPGLYFIGEVVDVTGWLGGYNFQWAWASGVAAGLRPNSRWADAARLTQLTSGRLTAAIIAVFPSKFLGLIYMTTIRVKENEPFDVALRRFKRTIEKLGLLTELRAREFYEKPTAERKRKKAAAVKRHYKRIRSHAAAEETVLSDRRTDAAAAVASPPGSPRRVLSLSLIACTDRREDRHEPERTNHRRHEGRHARQGRASACAPSAC